MIPPFILAVAEAAGEAAQPMPAETAIAWAIALMLLAVVLAIVEFLIVSWGMLLVGSVVAAVAAIALAFHAHPVAGWSFVAITPVLITAVVFFGLRLMRRTNIAILPTEVLGDAGVHHVAAAAGVGIGATGVLLTGAFPTGRARFQGTNGPVELVVRVQGAVLDVGEQVVIVAISGPDISVAATSSSPTQPKHPQG